MVKGETNADIARALVVSEGTVKFHVKNILRKLHASNRAEATSRYLRLSLRQGEARRAPALTPPVGEGDPYARGGEAGARPRSRTAGTSGLQDGSGSGRGRERGHGLRPGRGAAGRRALRDARRRHRHGARAPPARRDAARDEALWGTWALVHHPDAVRDVHRGYLEPAAT